MKKFLSIFLSLVIAFGVFTTLGCNQNQTQKPKYNVSVTATTGGRVTTDKSVVEFGDNVVLTVEENSGYVLASLKINGNEVEIDGNAYTIAGAMRDYTITATFVETDVIVTFDQGTTDELENKEVSYGGVFGKLPVPEVILGKRFTGWVDSNGDIVTESTVVSGESSVINLTSVWEEVSAEEKDKLIPFTITTAYHDMSATNYGLVWHNRTEPVYPVVFVQEGTSVDKTTARRIVADYEYWFWDEYVCNAVIDNLKFNTTYTAIMGDLSADVWSREYTFTTREEYDDNVEFIYITDTQENYLIENMSAIEGTYAGIGYLGTTYSSQVLKEATIHFPGADFITHGGDMVNYGIEAKYWEQMMGSYDEFLFNYPLMVTTGNHSEPLWYAFGSKDNIENKMFNVDWEEDAHASSGMIYSFNYGPLHFISLRSNDVFYEKGGVLTDRQISWLINDVAKARQNPNIKWVIAMMHEGPIVPGFGGTVNSNHHEPMLGGQLLPLFDELEIDMLLYGHNHYLDTTHPLVWDENATPLPYTDNPQIRYPNEPLAREHTVRPATTQTEEVTLSDGTVVDKYIYPQGSRRGTVYHQCMTSGMQMASGYKYNNLDALLAEKGGAEGVYRMLAAGAVGCLEVNGAPSTVPYSGYSYVQVTPTSLTVLSYGVDARGVYNETDPSKITNHSVYVDGFMLTK